MKRSWSKIKSRPVGYQFESAIERAFSPKGTDKHSIPKEMRGDNVYSYNERSNLKTTAYDLGKYLKSEHGVKELNEVKPEMVQAWLNEKATTCSQTTLDQYKSRLNKIEHLANRHYKTVNTRWSKEITVPQSQTNIEKTRDIAFEREDLNRIKGEAYSRDSQSKALVAVELAERYGLRVEETVNVRVKDINLDKGNLHVHKAKGGRNRDLPIKAEDREYLRKICEGKKENDKIADIRKDSVNKFLARQEEKLGIREKYQEAKTSVHAIRKLAAQREYDNYRDQGYTPKQAADKTMEWLGHGKGRMELYKAYIKNMW